MSWLQKLTREICRVSLDIKISLSFALACSHSDLKRAKEKVVLGFFPLLFFKAQYESQPDFKNLPHSALFW